MSFLFRLAFKNLDRNRRRTSAILLTVALGSASLFTFRGFNYGIMNQYRENTVHARFGHGQLNVKGYREQVFEKPWEHWIEQWPSKLTELKALPQVGQVFPRVEFFGLLTNGKITVSGRGQGVDGVEESKFFNTLNIENGVVLSSQEDGILMGRGLAKSLDVHVGDRITLLANTVNGSLNGADLNVIGIFHTGAKEFDDAVFRIPLNQALKLLDTDKIESIAIGLKSESDWSTFAQSASQKWPELEATSFSVLDEVYYQHSVDWLKSQFGIIQLIILTIVVLGIFNTVSTSVLERKQEIGNLRANGDSSQDILKLIFYEGLIVGSIGSGLGVGFALLLDKLFLKDGILMPPAPGLTRQFQVMLEFNFEMAMMSIGLSAAAAVLASIIAAFKVARMPISECLRST